MKKQVFFGTLALLASQAFAQQAAVTGPDSRLKLDFQLQDGKPVYSVTYDGKTVLENSPLGFVSNIGDFSRQMSFVGQQADKVEKTYTQDRIKCSTVNYSANKLTVTLENAEKKKLDIVFQLSNNDIAFRYEMPQYGETACMVIEKEATGFDFPSTTTTFLSPQSDPMIGWMRTKPSYEEEYVPDEPVATPSKYGEGYTFPALFHVGDNWALVSETGVRSLYCASHLSDATKDGLYSIAFPNPGEMNGLGSSTPGLALPGVTPWRTITVGSGLKPIVETTVPFDVVEPLYDPSQEYKFGRSTWSWIMWQDPSINYDDQIRFIDLASEMGYEYTLIDGGWEKNIGRDRMEELFKYAHQKNVDVFVWYNSNGYWNDAPQGPRGRMHNTIARHREMKWMKETGIRGIKVDFLGSDKQQTMQLYEDILADANDYGLMVIYHGCTLPRGWERMYPNFVASEAVLASENLHFSQKSCDAEAFNACLHPFIRNTVASMDFGGSALNKYYNAKNEPRGSRRVTSDVYALATAVLFQSPVQHFALTPNNLTDAPAWAIDFMKQVPATWDDVRFIDGYPGKYVILARRHGDKWYVAGVNAQQETLKTEITLPMWASGTELQVYADDKELQGEVKSVKLGKKQTMKVTIPCNGGLLIVG